MVTSVFLVGILFGALLYAGIGLTIFASKVLGYDTTSKYYYKRMAKKGAREASKIMDKSRTSEPTFREIKACVKHVLKPRYKLGNSHLRTVNTYFPKYSRKEKRYHQLIEKIESNRVNYQIAQKLGNDRVANKYYKKIQNLQGLKRNMELDGNYLSHLESHEVDWVGKIKFSKLGVEFADPTTYIKCFDKDIANEYLHYHYDGNEANGFHSRIVNPKHDKGSGYPHVAEIRFNNASEKKSLGVSALNKFTYDKGLSLLADKTIDIYNDMPEERKSSLFPIKVTQMVRASQVPNVSLADRIRCNLFSRGLMPVTKSIKNINELHEFAKQTKQLVVSNENEERLENEKK